MKKIALLGPAYPLRGGLAAFNERLAYALQAEGYQVTLYTFSLQYPSMLFPGKTQYSDDPAPENLEIYEWINSINPINWRQVGNKIAKTAPDILICAFWLPFMAPCLGTICHIVRRKAGTRIIGLVHNAIPHESRPGDDALAKYFIQSADAFLTLSESVANDVRMMDKQKPIVEAMHPIYDSYGEPVTKAVARQHLGLEQAGKYILFFGFIRAYKGLDVLIEAMRDSRIRSMGIKLIVAGEFYGGEEQYQQQIDEVGVRDLLILHNKFIANDEVRYYFGAADLVVQPYKTATQSGISQIAYHFEKPMVVTKVGGLPEIVPHDVAGYVTEVDDRAIGNAIVRFYDYAREADFIKGVQQEKKRFAWEGLVSRLEELF